MNVILYILPVILIILIFLRKNRMCRIKGRMIRMLPSILFFLKRKEDVYECYPVYPARDPHYPDFPKKEQDVQD